MKKYRIWISKLDMIIEADRIEIMQSGQTAFYIKDEIVTIAPPQALIVLQA